MLTNGDDATEVLEDPSFAAIQPLDSPTKKSKAHKKSSSTNSDVSHQLKHQNDAHIQVKHKGVLLLGLSCSFEQNELSVVLSTPEVDVHVFEASSVDPELIVSYLFACVVPHATLPIATKTNFGPPVSFHDVDVFRDWLLVNLKLIIQMKALWSGRPFDAGFMATSSNKKEDSLTTSHWDHLSRAFF